MKQLNGGGWLRVVMRTPGGTQLLSNPQQLRLNEEGDSVTTGAHLGTVSVPELPSRQACSRCGGRMLTSGIDGDLGCFSCGNQIYARIAEIGVPVRRRAASHGRQRLD